MTNWAIRLKAPQGTLYAYQRAIVLIVIVLLVGGLALAASVEPGVSREYFIFGTALAAAVGFASWLGSLWRILIGALIVFPLNSSSDGQFATHPVDLAEGLLEGVLYTWILPFLDPATSLWRWANNSKWSVIVFLKTCVLFGGYGLWLFGVLAVVYGLALITSQSGGAIGGFPADDPTTSYLIARMGAVVTSGLAMATILALVLGVPFWRSRKSGSKFPDPRREPAELPDVIAAAVSDTASKQS